MLPSMLHVVSVIAKYGIIYTEKIVTSFCNFGKNMYILMRKSKSYAWHNLSMFFISLVTISDSHVGYLLGMMNSYSHAQFYILM